MGLGEKLEPGDLLDQMATQVKLDLKDLPETLVIPATWVHLVKEAQKDQQGKQGRMESLAEQEILEKSDSLDHPVQEGSQALLDLPV